MFKNEYILSVDIKKSMSTIIPIFVQYDSATLVFKIYDNGKAFDLTDFTSAEVSHKLPDGTVVIGYGALETLSDGIKTIRYTYQGNEMSQPGFVSTSLSVYSADKKVSILPFKVEIVGDTYEESIGASPEIGILQQLITSVSGVSGQATQAVASANQAVAQANIAINNAQAIADNTRSIGAFNLSTAYLKNNIVTSNGSSWIALANTQNNPLPTLPTIQNTWWRLLAQKGADGTGGGTGVTVVDASTTEKGIVQLNNTLTSTSTSQAVTAAQAKLLNDNLTTHTSIVATTSQAGHVRPDGTTIIIDSNGIISSVGGGGSTGTGEGIIVSGTAPPLLPTGGIWYQVL
ncbi:BppU family phage baseplate upper protein [Solibacillus sp. FSL H8-0523]|uniref:BppU family phage baseplate upper protein n=1 Tax=Solibacillus sp. FSL H8-0523 TaxID=2954511 RepID=UPI00310192CD